MKLTFLIFAIVARHHGSAAFWESGKASFKSCLKELKDAGHQATSVCSPSEENSQATSQVELPGIVVHEVEAGCVVEQLLSAINDHFSLEAF